MNNSMLTFFVGIIAVCMIAITVVTMLVSGQVVKTLKEMNDLIAETKTEVKTFTARSSSAAAGIEAVASIVNLVVPLFKRKQN